MTNQTENVKRFIVFDQLCSGQSISTAKALWVIKMIELYVMFKRNLMCLQAEEELERAQKVFEEINIDLQEELPSLWNRCGFITSVLLSQIFSVFSLTDIRALAFMLHVAA